jgi:twitching motility protein PilT
MLRTNDFHTLIEQCVELGASDLHISSAALPHVRVDGRLQPLGKECLSASDVEQMALALMHPRQQEIFAQRQTMDLAYAHDRGERFRINVFRERGQTAMAIRRLDEVFRTLDELHLPKQLNELAELRDGLVLVTGPTGSGKTTTLATLIHQINCDRPCHIVTIEDPVEYLHANRQSLVHQRELYADVPTFAEAVRAALREDPNVILVGEMRDTETMHAAITAAETGHLVFSTLHSGDAAGALDRMLGAFPAAEQETIRHQLSMVLQAVVAQRLLPRADGQGRVPAVEILRITKAVSHLIRTKRSEQIYSTMETGSADGMQTMEQSLKELVVGGLLDVKEAMRVARDRQLFESRLQLAGAPRG